MPSDIISSNNNLIDKKSNTLLSRLKSNKSKKIVRNALQFSIEMHKNQKRKSGDPYVVHCIDVANILIDWNMDVCLLYTSPSPRD